VRLPRASVKFAAWRLTLRLDFAPGQAIGHGKIRLLEAVRDHGSISAAGRITIE
jgi:molybdenum-dependent DNA-binding transcriptional regulator ModE